MDTAGRIIGFFLLVIVVVFGTLWFVGKLPVVDLSPGGRGPVIQPTPAPQAQSAQPAPAQPANSGNGNGAAQAPGTHNGGGPAVPPAQTEAYGKPQLSTADVAAKLGIPANMVRYNGHDPLHGHQYTIGSNENRALMDLPNPSAVGSGAYYHFWKIGGGSQPVRDAIPAAGHATINLGR